MAGGGGGTEELNLVPYLDIMVNLIMFLITITAYIAEMRESPVLAPGGGQCKVQPCPTPKPHLTVAIDKAGFSIIGSADTINPTRLVLNGQGFPYDDLQSRLGEYKESIKDIEENIVITADSDIPYKTIMATMDAARADKKGKRLFPGVTFSRVVGQH